MSRDASARKVDIFTAARDSLAMQIGAAAGSSKPVLLYGPNGRALSPDSYYSFRRQAAQRKGSLKNWVPQRLYSTQQEARDREAIVARSVDLTNNDPHAAGVVDMFAATVAGSGLQPIPSSDASMLGLEKEQVRKLQGQQRSIYRRWYRLADATGRMSFGGIQYLCIRNLVEHGEYLMLLYMIDNPVRPYSLACHVINPQRLKTPVDKINDPRIRDGIEIGDYGEPVAYWIKLSSQSSSAATLPDTSENFRRIPASVGHRLNVIHRFVTREPEQVRGIPLLAPSMKFFRDLNDYLDTELVSNIVASAISLFIELQPGNDPLNIGRNLSTFTERGLNQTGTESEIRYQEMEPGMVMYGNTGEKPHLLSPDRPGTTFDPFTKIIKKAIAMGINIPYPVAFKDPESVNFAGFRSAMLDAWRVFMIHRTWLGEDTCQPIYTMLMEEGFLRGELEADNFYLNIDAITHCDWRGSPKGDIEPIKAVQADVLAIQNNIKTRAEAIAERGGDLRSTFDQLQEEQDMMRERGLDEERVSPDTADKWAGDEKRSDQGTVDDMDGAGNEGM